MPAKPLLPKTNNSGWAGIDLYQATHARSDGQGAARQGRQESLRRLGIDIVTVRPDEFKAFIASETPKWTAIVKASGATVEKG